MTIEQLGDKKVLISLCSQDMKDYSLSFDTMSLDNDHARKVIMRLLHLACNKTGISYMSRNVIVEALPYESGCMILATLMDKSKGRRVYKVRRLTQHPCAVFENIDDMMDAVYHLYQRERSLAPNSLWQISDGYGLVFEYPVVSAGIGRILSEYGKIKSLSRIQISRIKEQGRLICTGNAVEIIGSRLRGK